MPFSVFIVEDLQVVRETLRRICSVRCECEVSGEASTGAEAAKLLRHRRPDLLLIDLELPDMNGYELLHKVRTFWLHLPSVIAITCHCDDCSVSKARELSLEGFVDKNCESTSAIARAVRMVLSGGHYYSASYVTKLRELERDQTAFYKLLTCRQRDIIRLNAHGLDDREVSKRLKIALRTAGNHRLRAMSKLGINSVFELVAYAFKKGFWY
jgi:DNA-binding NarL/FixJ family response regulator